MSFKLSHSSINRFQMCGESYRLHYIEKLRPNVTHAALIFGSAIDAGLNSLLVPGKETPEVIFEANFLKAKINDKEHYIPTCTEIVYSNGDFDSDLLTEADYQTIKENDKVTNESRSADYLAVYKDLSDRKKASGFQYLKSNEKVLYNLFNWLCLRRKGLLMISAYRKKVMPKITRVLSVQEAVSLTNTVGDSIIGYVDLVAEINGKVVIIDNKTSGMEYDKDAVLSSAQLSLYVHMLEEKYQTREAGYIVMRKTVIKNRKKICSVCGHNGTGGRHKTCDAIVEGVRCNSEWNETLDPDIHVQILTDTIPEQVEKIVIENADSINETIKAGHFSRNLNSCSNWFGGKCCYFNKCYRASNEGLIDVNKERGTK